jgi:hypothetical protein
MNWRTLTLPPLFPMEILTIVSMRFNFSLVNNIFYHSSIS